MSNITRITNEDGQVTAEVYRNRIFELIDEFAASLPEDRNLSEPETFSGAIGFVYNHLFRPLQKQKNGSLLDYDDLETLDAIWQTYAELCGRYRQVPSILEYCTLTGVSRDVLDDWVHGRYRSNDVDRIHTIKQWKSQCEAALEKKCTGANSVGSIFVLKAGYGWRETAPVTAEVNNLEPHETVAEIMERFSSVELPERPDFDL